ncbi:MAG: BatA and WFA domain-containing protein [Bacteroidales bacterium]|nr:BatA and WFA domain-containing protein [Bacteroidales bacterium]
MQFLNAVFLWAGFAVLIPPVIHLFNFRRYKTVYFSDVRFLQNLKNITRKRSVLKQILLMVLRMAVIACLVITFSEPVISTGGLQNGQGLVKNAPPVIYIDNSFSMQAGEIAGLNLEKAKNKALEIAGAFPSGTQFLYIDNNFSSEHNRLVNADGIRTFLEELKTSPKAPTIGEVIRKALQNLSFQDVDINSRKSVFVISDFQKNICDFSALENDSLISINLVKVTSETQNNVSVDTVEFLTPYRLTGSEEEILVTVRNYGGQPVKNVPLKLYINNSSKCAETFDINPYEKKQIKLKYVNTEKNLVRGRISVSDFPINYDDDLYFGYKIDSVKKILIISDEKSDKYFDALFKTDKNFSVEFSSGEDTDNLLEYQTVVINKKEKIPATLSSRLQSFVSMGGNVIFVPSFSGDIESYNYLLSLLMCNTFTGKDTLRCKIANFNAQSLLLKNAIKSVPENVDLPVVNKYFNSTQNSYLSEETLLETDSYKKILTSNSYKAGKFYVFYTPLDEKSGTLVTHRLIVPLLYNAAAFSQNFTSQYYTLIGKDDGFTTKIPNYKEGVKVFLKADDSDFEMIPRISGPDGFMNFKIFSQNLIEKAGFYTLMIQDKPSNAFVAYNYDRKESDLDFFSADEVLEKLSAEGFVSTQIIETDKSGFSASAVENSTNKPIWKLFVILALAFAVAEICVGRFL